MCQHPNIISLFDIFSDSENSYIVLELLQGADLFDYVEKREFRMSENRVKEIAWQLTCGL
jgi:serine/threonine protein kinase